MRRRYYSCLWRISIIHLPSLCGGKCPAVVKDFLERDLSGFVPFLVLLDTVHRRGTAFVTTLGIFIQGDKKILGFWEGATENSEVCKELLNNFEECSLRLGSQILYVTDGGSGIKKCLMDRYGDKLQRCTIHKDRNIQRNLPKKYRRDIHRKYTQAISHVKYQEFPRKKRFKIIKPTSVALFTLKLPSAPHLELN